MERKELFIISKVWNDMHGEGKVLESCRKSLEDLGLDYFDLFFVHWPFPNYHALGCSGDFRNSDSRPFSVDEFMATWRQCEELADKGLVRHIGMSNMTVPKLEAVLPLCRIQPAALEMELHPSFQQPESFGFAMKNRIQPIGYCPIGSLSRPERDRKICIWGKDNAGVLVTVGIQGKYGKDMYVLSAKATWSGDDKPVITYISYIRIKEWKFTEKGWFCYELCVPEYPEVTENIPDYQYRIIRE